MAPTEKGAFQDVRPQNGSLSDIATVKPIAGVWTSHSNLCGERRVLRKTGSRITGFGRQSSFGQAIGNVRVSLREAKWRPVGQKDGGSLARKVGEEEEERYNGLVRCEARILKNEANTQMLSCDLRLQYTQKVCESGR